MNSMTAKLSHLATLAALTTLCATASAQEGRTVLPLSLPKSTEVAIDQYQATQTVTRERSAGRIAAIFRAEAAAIESGMVVVFRAVSQSEDGKTVARWQCFAVSNVSECFTKPVRISYLPKDARVMLEVSAHSAAEPQIAALLEAGAGQLAFAPSK